MTRTSAPGGAAALGGAVVRYDVMRSAIVECHRIDDAKDIADKALALQAYARQARDPDMERWVAEIRLRARRRVGELSAALDGAQGANQHLPRPGKKLEALQAAGLSTSEAHRCEQIAKVPVATFETYIAAQTANGRAVTADEVVRIVNQGERRTERMGEIAEISKGNAPLGMAERYPVLYVDAPWRYEHVKTESRAIENQYPTMSLDDIKAMPIDDVAFDDCVLFMWATSPKLAEALEVLEAWDFSYRTCAVWDKQKIGMGYYFRQQHELLLVAVRGEPPAPAPGDRPASLFSFPRGAHSSKPTEVYGLIEGMYPILPKLELFARSARDGWGAWGNQVVAA